MSAPDGKPTWTLSGRHVLLGLIAMFGIVVAVNLTFVFLALDTFTGVTTANPYQEGLAYNKVLDAREAQRELGWQGLVETDAMDGKDRITVTMSDAKGQPLSGLSLDGSLRRPVHAGMDQALTWREGQPGRYSAEVTLPERGNWDLSVSADDGSDPTFEMKTRLWFK